MPTTEQIYKSFSSTMAESSPKQYGDIWAIDITAPGDRYRTFSFRKTDGFGVFIQRGDVVEPIIDDTFSGVHIYCQNLCINEIGYNEQSILLESRNEATRKQFASVCYDFVCDEHRERIIENPFEWRTAWKELLGNKQGDIESYSMIGEMLVADWLLQKGLQIDWNEEDKYSSIDIVCEKEMSGHEVKSTTTKYGNAVQISSQFQLSSQLSSAYLYLIRFEKLTTGNLSLDSMKQRLVSHGYDENNIEEKLKERGFLKGSEGRRAHYNLLEARRYPIDSDFPIIDKSSFVSGNYPNGVLKIEYTVDLSNLKCENIDYVC